MDSETWVEIIISNSIIESLLIQVGVWTKIWRRVKTTRIYRDLLRRWYKIVDWLHREWSALGNVLGFLGSVKGQLEICGYSFKVRQIWMLVGCVCVLSSTFSYTTGADVHGIGRKLGLTRIVGYNKARKGLRLRLWFYWFSIKFIVGDEGKTAYCGDKDRVRRNN